VYTTVKVSGLWYHGDAAKRERFDDQKMDRDRGTADLNAVGPGIYLTRDLQQARGYAWPAGWIYTFQIRPRARVLDEKAPPVRAVISKMIDLAPADDREVGLSNYAEAPVVARYKVETGLVRERSLLDALIVLYHEFYGHDANAWAAAMVQLGFDALLHRLPEVDHLVVYNPEILVRVREKRYEPHKESAAVQPTTRKSGRRATRTGRG
jgi:hypothetical protein